MEAVSRSVCLTGPAFPAEHGALRFTHVAARVRSPLFLVTEEQPTEHTGHVVFILSSADGCLGCSYLWLP